MSLMQFSDQTVTYERFLNDVSNIVVEKLEKINKYPKYISQRQAYKLFGEGNVDRWRQTEKIKPMKRPGKVEYKTSELIKLQETNYL